MGLRVKLAHELEELRIVIGSRITKIIAIPEYQDDQPAIAIMTDARGRAPGTYWCIVVTPNEFSLVEGRADGSIDN